MRRRLGGLARACTTPCLPRVSFMVGNAWCFSSTNPFTSKLPPNKHSDDYGVDVSGDGSSGEHEAGAGPGSSIDPKTLDLKFTTSDIDLIPMNKTQLTAIPGNTTGKTSFRENFVNVLLNLDIDNVQMLKKKYYIASSNLQTVYKIIKILAFETLLLDEIGAISYRNLRSTNEFISVLPDWPTNQKPSRTNLLNVYQK